MISPSRISTTPGVVALVVVVVVVPASVFSKVQPPTIIEQPATNEIIFDARKNVELKCVAEADPPAVYQWRRFGRNFDPSGSEGRISMHDNSGTLTMQQLEKEDEGLYQCNATNKYGSALTNNVFLRMGVLEKFGNQEIVTRTVSYKKSITLNCNPPRGLPQPHVFWSIGRGGDLPMTKRRTQDPEGNLHFLNVQPEDEIGGEAYICNAFNPVLRNIQTGDRQIIKVIQDGGGSSPPTLLWGTPINSLVLVGETLRLKCIFGGYPVPEVTWVKSVGDKLPAERVDRTSYQQELTIRDVKETDAGTYQCTASNSEGSPQTHTVIVRVQSRPTFTEQTNTFFTNRIMSERSTVELPCEAHGDPTPEISLFMNGIPIETVPANSRRTVKAGTIRIRDLKSIDTGVFQCNASNTHGYVFKNAYVNVMNEKPSWLRKPMDLKVVADQEAILQCETFGAPVPTITWIQGGQALTGGRYEILTFPRGSLLIRQVAFSDAGDYTCIARNTFGEISATAKLKVHKKTVIMSKPQDAEKTAGTEATFRCTAISDESNPMEIVWRKNGSPMDVNKASGRVYINDIDNSLVISGLQDTDSATYTCVARTELDEATADADLIVQDVPNQMDQPEVKQCDVRFAVLNWVPNGDNRAPILNYVVQFSTDFQKGSWEDIGPEMPANKQTDRIELTPWANYTFRVIARNKIGMSVPSPASKVCTTPEDTPDKNPSNVKGEGTASNNIVISWTKMPKIDQNGVGFYYQVGYRRAGTQKFILAEIRNADVTSYTITDSPEYAVPVYIAFDIQVIAFNSKGQSSLEPQIVTGFSGESAPTEKPENFRCSEPFGPTQVTCSWNKVREATLNGRLMGYSIQFWVKSEGEQQMQEVEFQGSVDTGTVHILRPNSEIGMAVVVRNMKYSSLRSNEVTVRTPEGRPGPVQKLRVIPVGSNSLELNWGLPLMPNGIIRGYRVYFREVDGLILGQEVLGKEINVNDTRKDFETILSGLKESTMYRVMVHAFTTVGEGETNFVEEQTTVSGKPDTPNLQIADVGDHHVNITIVRANTNNPGSVFFAQYKLSMDAAWISTSEQRERMWIYIGGLTSGAAYDARVVAKNGNTLTQASPAKSFLTEGAGSGSLATAGWIIGLVIMLFLLVVIIVIAVFVKKRMNKPVQNVWINGTPDQDAATLGPSEFSEDEVFSPPPDARTGLQSDC